jgi:predicted DNA-binding protein with PD1-like motif
MTITTTSARHLLFRLPEGSRLPDALHGGLRDEIVLCGWLRASGVLADVELRVLGRAEPRTLAGPLHVVALEGSIGLANGDVSCGLRAVLARETDSGLETLAGEITSARVVAFEALVIALDEATATRQRHAATGVWLLDAVTPNAPSPKAPAVDVPVAASALAPVVAAATGAPAPAAPAPPPPVAPSATSSDAWAAAAKASEEATRAARPAQGYGGPIPQRPARPVLDDDDDQPVPDPGDVVEHFAFGRCEVIKSDGDRLHVRLGKEGRVKEIALEMLRVTPLPLEEGQTSRHYKLARKL